MSNLTQKDILYQLNEILDKKIDASRVSRMLRGLSRVMPHIEQAFLQIFNKSSRDELRELYPYLVFEGEQFNPENMINVYGGGRIPSKKAEVSQKNIEQQDFIQFEVVLKRSTGLITHDQLPIISRAIQTLMQVGIDIEIHITNNK